MALNRVAINRPEDIDSETLSMLAGGFVKLKGGSFRLSDADLANAIVRAVKLPSTSARRRCFSANSCAACM